MKLITNKQINIQLDGKEIEYLLEILSCANNTDVLSKEAKQLSINIEIAIGPREDY